MDTFDSIAEFENVRALSVETPLLVDQDKGDKNDYPVGCVVA
jgi:hypothetical protein